MADPLHATFPASGSSLDSLDRSNVNKELDLARRAEVHNFSAGQSVVDTGVLLQLQAQLLNYENTGMSLLEMSQRDADGEVQRLIRDAEVNVRTILDVPDDYSVLIMHGGAHSQFSAVPLNLLKRGGSADYICTGFWSQRSAAEASKHIDVRQIQPEIDELSKPELWNLNKDAAYVHICYNETISGIAINEDIDFGPDHVVVADMTSTLLSRPVDISKYGCIYASSGKNLGPAGICLVIVRHDLLECGADHLPSILSWKMQHQCGNIYNTPNVFGIWAMNEVIKDFMRKGGMEWIQEEARTKTSMLYDVIDGSNGFYCNRVPPEHRSLTAIPFFINGGNPEMEALFISKASEKGIQQIFGHASVGGLRAAIYNASPRASVAALCQFMAEFQAFVTPGASSSLT
uniref:phosphoserine transaminase n=1 Tax=Eutreptiella gymnastica TaxID=73025 RepID=A0A7S1I371_9EUGL